MSPVKTGTPVTPEERRLGLRGKFPPAVLATAFATLIAFMGIGVVDPILPAIGRAMGASPPQIEMLFTTYIGVMAVTMLISGVLSTRLGGRRVMLMGLGLVSVSAFLSGHADGITMLAAVRGFWGFGNAMFTSTALAIIVGASSGTVAESITLYEAALGLGIASGPLLGGYLGSVSWRDPFFGTSALMALAFLATFATVRDTGAKERPRTMGDMLHALGHPAVLTNALVGLGYSYAFFTVLAYSPIALNLSPHTLGIIYFLWGLLVAVSSVWLVNVLRPILGPVRMLLMNLVVLAVLFVLFAAVPGKTAFAALIVVSGLFSGISNALFTTLAIQVSPFSRSISSAAYNFLRWAGAALAPLFSGMLALAVGVRFPFLVGAFLIAAGFAVLLVRRRLLEDALRQGSGTGDA